MVSVPSWELFNQQNESYKQTILGDEEARVAVEAANSMGWESFIGLSGIMIGMDSFGASAPAKDLYNHFGITTEKVVSAIRKQLNN